MALLVIGMCVFLGVHLLPTFDRTRERLRQDFGEVKYKLGFTLISVIGFVMIVFGKAGAEFITVWNPPPWGRLVPPILMLPAFFCLVAKGMPTNLKRVTPHPMLWGVTLWAAAHLLANGDQASIVLFGGFGAFAVFDIWSANRRGARTTGTQVPWSRDLIVLAIAVGVYALFLFAHPYLFGVPVM